MKTTLELPDDLIREIKLRAVREGRKLKDAVAELLRKGLAKSTEPKAHRESALTKDKKTGLPLIKCRHPAAPGQEWTPQRVAELLIEQEARWHHDAGR